MAKATKKDEKTVRVLIDKKSLLAAAKDINKADIADPAINLDDDEAGLKKALLAAAEIIEPDDPLKKETFLLLKQLQAETPEEIEENEDVEENEPEETPEEIEDDADEETGKPEKDVEKTFEDMTTKELQEKCKAAGLPFKEKKTTKAQLIAMLEANEEDPEPEPVQAKKKADKPVKSKTDPRDFSKSNKAIVWKAWKEGKGETDSKKLHKLVPEIKESTICGWLKMWPKGKGLPAIANKK